MVGILTVLICLKFQVSNDKTKKLNTNLQVKFLGSVYYTSFIRTT